MKTMIPSPFPRTTSIHLLLVLILALCVGCSSKSRPRSSGNGDGEGVADSGTGADASLPSDGGMDHDTGSIDAGEMEEDAGKLEGWEGMEIIQASAPDRETVVIRFNRDPGEDEATDVNRYVLSIGAVDLTIGVHDYDPGQAQLTLYTSRQTVGSYIAITVSRPDSLPPLAADIPSADTAEMWVTDFDDWQYGTILKNFYRVGISDHVALYVEDGYQMDGGPNLVNEFNNRIFPVLTNLLREPSDMDQNGRILILAEDGGDHYGGYFSPINHIPDHQAQLWWGVRSNEAEIIHINVRSNAEEIGHIAAHEFQHLLYHVQNGLTDPYWAYHDEGLAEAAVHAVYGENTIAWQVYLWDPEGVIGAGDVSLVNWVYARYENYALAYLFWTYLAGMANGVDFFSEIFHLPSGSPDTVDALVRETTGRSFPEAAAHALLASWVMAPQGPLGYNGMLNFPAGYAPAAASGTTQTNLLPYTGAFFRYNNTPITPIDNSPNIAYFGIDSSGAITDTPPFNVAGGALLAYNMNFNHNGAAESAEPGEPAIGPNQWWGFMPSLKSSQTLSFPRWLNPPPINPNNMEPIHSWRASLDRMRSRRP